MNKTLWQHAMNKAGDGDTLCARNVGDYYIVQTVSCGQYFYLATDGQDVWDIRPQSKERFDAIADMCDCFDADTTLSALSD